MTFKNLTWYTVATLLYVPLAIYLTSRPDRLIDFGPNWPRHVPIHFSTPLLGLIAIMWLTPVFVWFQAWKQHKFLETCKPKTEKAAAESEIWYDANGDPHYDANRDPHYPDFSAKKAAAESLLWPIEVYQAKAINHRLFLTCMFVFVLTTTVIAALHGVATSRF